MSSGTGSTPKPMSKPGGNPRTMLFGMAAVAAGLGAFYYSQLYFHKGGDQTFLQRQNQKVDDKDVNLRIVGGKQDPILKPKASTYISTPPSQ